MAFTNFNTGTAPENTELAYDLRQMYAKIVGEHLEDIAKARKADNYSVYFKTLKDLHVIVFHKFKTKKQVDPITKEKIDDVDTYNKLLKAAVEVANKYSREWLGQSKGPVGCNLIEDALNNIEMFLYQKIDDANMFGSNKRIEGL